MAPARNKFYVTFPSKDPNPDLLRVCGPILNVLVHVPGALAQLLGQQGSSVPAPQPGMALIDTGASNTRVHEPILKALGLNPIGSMTSGTAAGPTQHSLYPVRLEFPADHIDREFDSVVGVDLSGQVANLSTGPEPIIALIGRDVLRDWILIYNGIGGVISIAF